MPKASGDLKVILLGTLLYAAGSAIFYVVTNTGSWLSDPGYAKTAAGWVEALTTGLPGYLPTWMFFRATLASDLLFTGIFIGCMAATRKRGELPDEAQMGTVPAGR